MPVPDFSPGEVLTAAAMDSIGLWLIGETTFATTANPFINGCFSSNFRNYRVLISATTSATTSVRLRWRFGTSTTETALQYDRFGTQLSGATMTSLVATGESSFAVIATTSGATELAPIVMDVHAPNVAIKTVAQSNAWNSANGATWLTNCRMNNTTQYTGLEIFADSGTITGSIRVYGYRN
jgi:hypothetical protein